MNTSLMGSKIDSLLSQLTGQKLENFGHPVVFLASVLAVLNAVIFADGIVTEEEKEKSEITIKCLCSHGNHLYELAKIISKNLRQQKLYSIDNIMTLTESLSVPEKLLILSLGYEMSVSDRTMEISEQKYLKHLAFILDIESQYQTALEAVLVNQENIEPDLLANLYSLLDPSRFRELDKIFVLAAEQICEQLPHLEKHNINKSNNHDNSSPPKGTVSYQELEKFQVYRQKIESLCHQMLPTLMECNQGGVLNDDQIQELEKITKLLNSDAFRVAVVGDFSQGKSTLLNALLGEKIQPVRTIPCSGTVSVLKYGKQKRVICVYKNGKEEEISLEQYQEKVSIDKDIALDSTSEGLKNNSIKEVIFEHPNLELCKNGVTILDSPGLNEHPDRTSVTEQILKDIDAVIFLTDASRPLTQGERELIQDLKTSLNGGNSDQPASNLFLVVNKWDLLDEEQERQDVKERIERIVLGNPALIAGENRIHFVSAQKVLKAIIEQSDSEHLDNFQHFTQSLETFLAKDIGSLKIQNVSTKITGLIKVSLEQLSQGNNNLEDKIRQLEKEQQRYLEDIGEISGRNTKIQILANELYDQAIDKTNESWNEFLEGLNSKLASRLQNWSSEHSAIWSRDKLVKDYIDQFNRDLTCELETWIDKKLKNIIMKRYLTTLYQAIKEQIKALESNIGENNNFTKSQVNSWKISMLDAKSVEEVGGYLSLVEFGAMDLLGSIAGVFSEGILFPIVRGVAGLLNAGALIEGIQGACRLDQEIRNKVCELGLEHFYKSSEPTEKIVEVMIEAFNNQVEQADELFTLAISMYEKSIETLENDLQKIQKDQEANQAFIRQKSQELQQFSKQIEQLVNDF